jgi:hypothetical protein
VDGQASVATQLAFTVQPSNTSANAAITPAIQVTARDAQGNTATDFTGNIVVAMGTNPGGGVLEGIKTRRAVAGVATFPNLRIKKSGAGYTLTATAANQTAATSAAFDITPGAATQFVAFAVPNAVAGVAISPAVQVRAVDAYGNTAPSFAGNVTMTIVQGPAGSALFGTTTVAAVAGVATFSDLSIRKANKPALKYKLKATSGTFTANSSPAFDIFPAAASQLIYTRQPSTAKAGERFDPAVTVTALDQFANVATGFTGDVTVAIGTNPGGGTLAGATTRTAVAGVATFGGTVGLSIDKAGTGYTLVATADGLTSVTSVAFNITPAAPAQLAFTVQPSNTAPGATITPAVEVTARDAQGNTATGFNGSITVAIANNPGGGTLAGTKTRNAVAGVATFNNLSINAAGTGYTLQATSANKTPATSNAFKIGSVGDLWTAAASMPVRSATLGAATINGILYAVGGFNGTDGDLATLQAYDPTIDTWTTKASMPTARQVLGVAAIDGILYAVGGYHNGFLSTLEAYDPTTNMWTTKASMPTPRSGLGVAAINGILFAVGGNGSDGRVVEAYDPATDMWTTKASMPTARQTFGIAAINGILYAVGGDFGSSSLATVEAYDPVADAWTTKASMPTGRSNLGAGALNGALYAVGGFNGATLGTLEAYDPATNMWTTKASMVTARSNQGVAAIDGVLYVAGGYDGDTQVATVEAYHP